MRRLGNQRELKVRDMLRKLGYRADRISVSGWTKQKPGEDDLGVPADVIGYAPAGSGLPHTWIEVGGSGKRFKVTFEKMKPLPPGHIAIIAVVVGRKWRFLTESSEHKTLEEALHGDRPTGML